MTTTTYAMHSSRIRGAGRRAVTRRRSGRCWRMRPMTNEATLPGPDERRRGLLFAGVGAVAAIAGAGLAIWKWGASGSAKADPALWAMNFDSPAGAPLAMQ